jgi:hypothetical protein
VAAVVIPPAAEDILVEVADIRAVEVEATTESNDADDVSEVKVRGEKGVLNGTPFLLLCNFPRGTFESKAWVRLGQAPWYAFLTA